MRYEFSNAIHGRGRVSYAVLLMTALVGSSCRAEAPREKDLLQQPDRWVNSVALDADSTAKFIGKTKQFLITNSTTVQQVELKKVTVGDEIEGMRIGAIQCSFHWRDASYGGAQYMWRGRWACKAGRTKEEVETAVADDGTKRHDYIHLAPVSLPSK